MQILLGPSRRHPVQCGGSEVTRVECYSTVSLSEFRPSRCPVKVNFGASGADTRPGRGGELQQAIVLECFIVLR